MTSQELDRRIANHIRTCRRKAGISQAELSQALGYRDAETVARHEALDATPPLEIAICYEIVFRIPVAEMFAGLRNEMEQGVEARLRQLEAQLGARSVRDGKALATARKLVWLAGRKDPNSGIRT